MGHIGVEIKNKGVLRSWKGNVQAETKPADNLDQLKNLLAVSKMKWKTFGL